MVFDLAAWAVILLAAGLVGRGALALLGADGLRRGDHFLLSAWIGVVFIAIGLLGVSLVAPLTPAVAACTVAALATLGAVSSARTRAPLISHTDRRSLVPRWAAVCGTVAILSGAAALASDPVTLYDSLVYHVGSIRWLREYGTVPGLALIHNRLGHVSAWFALAAPFDAGPGTDRSANVPLGFALALVGFQTALAAVRIASRQSMVSDWFLALASGALIGAAATGNAASPSPDVVTNVLIVVTAWSLLVTSARGGTTSAPGVAQASMDRPAQDATSRDASAVARGHLVPYVIALGACAMKLFAVPAAFAAALYALVAPPPAAASRAYVRRLVVCVAIAAVVLGPLVAANVVASGCPAFPSPAGCIDALPWSVGSAHAADYATYVRDVARWERRGETSVGSSLGWIGAWIFAHPLVTLLALWSPLSGIVLARRALRLRASRSTRRDGAGVRAVVVLAIAGIAFAAWYAPAPRFLYGYVIVVPALSIALAAQSHWRASTWTTMADGRRLAAIAFVVVAAVSAFAYAIASQKLNVRSAVASGAALLPARGRQFLVPTPPEVPARIFRWRVNDVDVFTPVPRPIADTLGYRSVIPTDAGFEKCSTAPLPCTPYLPDSDVRLRRPSLGMAGGFVRAARPDFARRAASCVGELMPMVSSPTTWAKAPPATDAPCSDSPR